MVDLIMIGYIACSDLGSVFWAGRVAHECKIGRVG